MSPVFLVCYWWHMMLNPAGQWNGFYICEDGPKPFYMMPTAQKVSVINHKGERVYLLVEFR